MNLTKEPKSPVDKKLSKRLKTTHLIVVIVVSPILALSAVYSVLWYIGYFGPKPTAVVDCESWRIPCCMEKELTDPCSPATHVDPSRLVKLLKEQGMYHMYVHNDSGYPIVRARVKIPDADYVEVKREDSEQTEAKRYLLSSESWELGNIDHGDTIEVNAWAKNKPTRQLAKGIWINHESDGPSATPYIRTPANFLGRCTNRYTIWVVLVAAALVLGPLVVYKYKLCRYFCDIWSQSRD